MSDRTWLILACITIPLVTLELLLIGLWLLREAWRNYGGAGRIPRKQLVLAARRWPYGIFMLGLGPVVLLIGIPKRWAKADPPSPRRIALRPIGPNADRLVKPQAEDAS